MGRQENITFCNNFLLIMHCIVRGESMDNLFYLLNMTVSGIKNIKKDVRLDFYKKTIDKSFDPEKYKILKF